jgi:hypothetical protein
MVGERTLPDKVLNGASGLIKEPGRGLPVGGFKQDLLVRPEFGQCRGHDDGLTGVHPGGCEHYGVGQRRAGRIHATQHYAEEPIA